MTKQLYYPKAQLNQMFSSAYPGTLMRTVNVCTWHSTETSDWPGYNGGSMAPTLTAKPNFEARTVSWRQHFATNESARALENRAGNVETNTLNNLQVEIIGTCVRGGPGMYLPTAPDWFLQGLAEFAAWLSVEWEVPLTTGVTWKDYGDGQAGYSSAGLNNGVRMSFADWNNYTGHCGHQHVPENVHGDPGNLNMARILYLASILQSPPAPAGPVVNIPHVPLPVRNKMDTHFVMACDGAPRETVVVLGNKVVGLGALPADATEYALKVWPLHRVDPRTYDITMAVLRQAANA